jgi:ssDNA-binding Zn-finger/Zn-ribbon topoisomerase 1
MTKHEDIAVSETPKRRVIPDMTCPECGAPMLRRVNKHRVPFAGCEKYPECTGTAPLPKKTDD